MYIKKANRAKDIFIWIFSERNKKNNKIKNGGQNEQTYEQKNEQKRKEWIKIKNNTKKYNITIRLRWTINYDKKQQSSEFKIDIITSREKLKIVIMQQCNANLKCILGVPFLPSFIFLIHFFFFKCVYVIYSLPSFERWTNLWSLYTKENSNQKMKQF